LAPSSGCVDATVVFMDTGGYLTMCGHGAMGLVTAAIERGLVVPSSPGKMVLDSPAGIVELRFVQEGDRVTSVAMQCVPSYLLTRDLDIDVPEAGAIRVDVGFGGNFCVIVEPQERVPAVNELDQHTIVRWGRDIRRIVNDLLAPVHPISSHLTGVKQVMFTGPARHPEADFMNAVFYGERSVDRSPCGTGTAARMAQLNSRGQLDIG
jgi:4-hydroxyproline epimerase